MRPGFPIGLLAPTPLCRFIVHLPHWASKARPPLARRPPQAILAQVVRVPLSRVRLRVWCRLTGRPPPCPPPISTCPHSATVVRTAVAHACRPIPPLGRATSGLPLRSAVAFVRPVGLRTDRPSSTVGLPGGSLSPASYNGKVPFNASWLAQLASASDTASFHCCLLYGHAGNS